MAFSNRPQVYSDAIQRYSLQSTKDTLYAGQQYIFLATLLQQSERHDQSRGEQHDLAIVQTVGPECERKRLRFSYKDLHQLLNLPQPQGGRAQVLFLRGFLPPSWIRSLGAKYIIDPEFFRQHLDLPFIPKCQSVFATPCLPSTKKNALTLRVSTISRTDLAVNGTQRRGRIAEDLTNYFRGFCNTARPGDSLVRSFYSLNSRYNVVEQDISICVEEREEGWTAVVWLDTGKDLTGSPPGPWTQSKLTRSTFLPVPHHVRQIALTHEALKSKGERPPARVADCGSLPQSATHLAQEFDMFLDKNVAAQDALYTLSPLFSFAAESEIQFLNLLQELYDDIANKLGRDEQSTVALQILTWHKQLLDQHSNRVEETLRFLRSCVRTQWPHASGKHKKKADLVKSSLSKTMNISWRAQLNNL
ncbi:hypothetical protein K469DRAFT_683668 [Zopfia rhizophila CBS 207.26]|uniref:Uncharacterized protein n=1 Tax=Zopfia rhizophila CBS 207.26 TaxID=1314779 RepID=A0A6A6EDW3_9PEZI|nr:hypothetical protein K469DRAFT_683668 [Zopfia rhizophila CBS 207.26]